VLGLVISDMLFRAFPKADEGELSRRLADLVRKETCAEIARTIELGAAIRLGSSEANAGGRKRPAILADVCEALIGAVYLDGGYSAAEALVERLWQVRACGQKRSRCAIRRPCCRNGRRRAACRRRPIARSRAPGPTTTRSFASPCSFPNFAPAEGSGRSKRAAEQAAAAAMMKREGVKPDRRNG
jgi:ribonuclease-3